MTGPTCFCGTMNVAWTMTGSKVVDIVPWPRGEWEKALFGREVELSETWQLELHWSLNHACNASVGSLGELNASSKRAYFNLAQHYICKSTNILS